MAPRNPDASVRILNFAPGAAEVIAQAIADALSGVTVVVPGSVEVSNDEGNPVPVSGPLTNAELRLAEVVVSQDSGEHEYLHAVGRYANSGDHTLIAAPADPTKAIRLHYFYAINKVGATADPYIEVRFGSDPPIYGVWAFAKRQQKTGSPGDELIVNLDVSNGDVACVAIYEEVVP